MSSISSKEPLNFLSLDGGGVRGVSELVMLDRIMRRLQSKKGLHELPRPCDYFDLIAGTSTGGLIAILLGRLRMTTEEALKTYDEVAGDIFSESNKKKVVGRVANKLASKFKATTLQTAVEKIVAERNDGDLMGNSGKAGQKGKAFVCAAAADKLDDVHRFRTYEAEHDAEQWLKDCKIWEAARATTAAPVFFKGIEIKRGPVTKMFVDAALGCNNPSEELLDEAGRIFHPRRKLGALLSLGTGTRPNGLLSPEDFGYLPSIIKAMKNITTSPEKPHERLKTKFEDFPNTYFRFNVPDGALKVGLEDWQKMAELKDMTTQYLDQEAINRDIDGIVDVLAQKKTAGLTIGIIAKLDKDQLLMDSREARPMGSASSKFVGRRDILQRLDECFSPRDTQQHRRRRHFLLCGMGGAGKTQIALKFAENAGERFKYIFWVDAESLATATRSYKDIAVEEMSESLNSGPPMKDVHAWIASLKDEWLLILDNSDAEYINDVIPPGNKGNVIYTSRHRSLGLSLPEESVALVEDLEQQDAVTLLLNAAGKITYSPERREEAAPIATELGCLALALDQAGSYISQMGCSLSEWLELYRSRREILLKNEHFKGADPRNQTVYATFDISYRAIKELANDLGGWMVSDEARRALDILNILCFYHNEGVPVDMFTRAAFNRRTRNDRKRKDGEKQKDETKDNPENEPENESESRANEKDKAKEDSSRNAGNEAVSEIAPFVGPDGQPSRGTFNELMKADRIGDYIEWNWLPFRLAVSLLEDFSIVNMDAACQNLSMHTLTHTWARDRMGDAQRLECGLLAAEVLRSSSPYMSMPDADHVFFQRKIAPHFEALQWTLNIGRRPEASEEDSDAAYQYEYDDPKLQSELDIGLGYLAQEFGDLATAEYLFRKAINGVKWAALDDEPTLIAMQALARFLENQYRVAEAEELQLQVFERAQWSLGEAADLTLQAMYDLMSIYRFQSRSDIAETMWRNIIQRKERRLGTTDPQHPELASDWAGLERFLDVGGTTGSELERLQKEIQTNIDNFGHLDPHGLALQQSLALELGTREHKRYDEAETQIRDCMATHRLLHGRYHRKFLGAAVALARILDQRKCSIKAEGLLRELLADYQRLFGPRDLETVDCLYYLGQAIVTQGRFDEGLMLLGKAYELREFTLGFDHPDVVISRKHIYSLLRKALTIGPSTRRKWARRTMDLHEGFAHTDEEADIWTSRRHFCAISDHPNPQPELVYFTAQEINRPQLFPRQFETPAKNKLHADVEHDDSTVDRLDLAHEFE